jgi:hypothetical protein
MESEQGRIERNTLTMENGAVTLFDVLGWKGVWQRIPNAMETLEEIRDLVEKLQELEVKQNTKFSGLEPRIWVLSDTIVFTTYGKAQVVLPFHVQMTENLLSFYLTVKLPVRGAIGYGLFSSMDKMLVGPAVDEVASWYEAVEWVGEILTPTSSFYYREDDYPADDVLDYVVPLTKGGRYSMKCVDWFGAFKNEEDLLRSFLATASVITPNVAPKYLNTIEFFRYIQKLKETKMRKRK